MEDHIQDKMDKEALLVDLQCKEIDLQGKVDLRGKVDHPAKIGARQDKEDRLQVFREGRPEAKDKDHQRRMGDRVRLMVRLIRDNSRGLPELETYLASHSQIHWGNEYKYAFCIITFFNS